MRRPGRQLFASADDLNDLLDGERCAPGASNQRAPPSSPARGPSHALIVRHARVRTDVQRCRYPRCHSSPVADAAAVCPRCRRPRLCAAAPTGTTAAAAAPMPLSRPCPSPRSQSIPPRLAAAATHIRRCCRPHRRRPRKPPSRRRRCRVCRSRRLHYRRPPRPPRPAALTPGSAPCPSTTRSSPPGAGWRLWRPTRDSSADSQLAAAGGAAMVEGLAPRDGGCHGCVAAACRLRGDALNARAKA